MRLGELVGKEIINIFDGMRLGTIANSDMMIDPETGEIESIILPKRPGFLNFWIDRGEIVVPWKSVKKIGNEVIIIELDNTYTR
ncbi:MAG: YlmC/YmxH family sporulation protein [Thermacetogeniaceae bacterium]